MEWDLKRKFNHFEWMSSKTDRDGNYWVILIDANVSDEQTETRAGVNWYVEVNEKTRRGWTNTVKEAKRRAQETLEKMLAG